MSLCLWVYLRGYNLNGKFQAWCVKVAVMDTFAILVMVAQLAVAIFAVWKSSKKR
jgi:hypothetical protein